MQRAAPGDGRRDLIVGVEKGEEDKGFVAVRVNAGKAQKPIELSLENLSGQPTVVADHVLWLAKADKTELVATAIQGARAPKDFPKKARPVSHFSIGQSRRASASSKQLRHLRPATRP